MNFLYAIAVTIGFTLFDLWLFPLTKDADGEPNKWRRPYRALQIIVQLGLYTGAFFLGGWSAAAASAVIWWTGGCDVLFYWFGKYEFWGERNWFWMWWTPLGLVRGRRENLMNSVEVFRQSIIGAGIGVAILNLGIVL